MRHLFRTIAIYAAVFASQPMAEGANYLTVDFGSVAYSNGQLIPGSSTAAGAVGQDGWAQLGSSSASPILISGGYGVLGPTGQDVYHAFTGSANLVALNLTKVYTRYDFKISDNASFATSTNDELIANLSFSGTLGNTSAFGSRLGIKRSGSGFLIGSQLANGGGAIYAYGSTLYSFDQTYSVINVWNRVSGTLNDTYNQLVASNSGQASSLNQSDFLSQYAEDQAYGTSTVAEPTGVVALNLRQGTLGPTVSFSRILVGDTLPDVNVIPEPSSSFLMAWGLLVLAGMRTLRRKSA